MDFSGFDPAVFAAEHYALSRLPFKVWRLAFDEEREANDVERVIQCLRACGVPSNQIAAYVVVGFGDSPAESLARAIRVIEWRGEPRVQAYRPLTWLDSDRPFVNHARGWTTEWITAIPRYFYGDYWRRRITFDEFLAYTRACPFERAASGYYDIWLFESARKRARAE